MEGESEPPRYICYICCECHDTGRLNERTGKFICSSCLKGRKLKTRKWKRITNGVQKNNH